MRRFFFSTMKTIPAAFSFAFLFSLMLGVPVPAFGNHPDQPEQKQNVEEPTTGDFKRFELEYEASPYYTWLDLIIALTEKPIPHLGEKTELETYSTLLSRSALLPQFLVLEASVNPMPCLGAYVKSNARHSYDDSQTSNSFNWIKALTAGFEEPYAFSVLVGNVANFSVPGKKDITGLGYSGYLVSYGNYHIKDNTFIRDEWWEFEWKVKGDRKSPIKKLNWSFRIGAKEHGNKNITDVLYLSFRRSRVDYKSSKSFLLNNSGFEYTFDLDRRSFSPVRHYFTVDKKWPFENRQIALSLAIGFVWESTKKYKNELATEQDNFQFIIRPNIEF